jgi:hypothetical protein
MAVLVLISTPSDTNAFSASLLKIQPSSPLAPMAITAKAANRAGLGSRDRIPPPDGATVDAIP